MKQLLFIFLLCLCGVAGAQRRYVYGVVRDSLSGDEMIGVHIRNIDAGSLTSSNEDGRFKIPSKVGDTLVLSNVGYKTLAWIADSSWFENREIEFLLPVNTIYLDEVVVGEFPEYVRFKDQIVNMKVEDTTFQIFGVPKVVMDPYPQMEKSDYLNLKHIVGSPISTIHHLVSKKEKEKRKMQQINKRRHITSKAYLKFTREWVAENTNLKGDKLTSFIAYCDFSIDYLASATVFDIHQRMMALLPDFLEEYEEKERFREG